VSALCRFFHAVVGLPRSIHDLPSRLPESRLSRLLPQAPVGCQTLSQREQARALHRPCLIRDSTTGPSALPPPGSRRCLDEALTARTASWSCALEHCLMIMIMRACDRLIFGSWIERRAICVNGQMHQHGKHENATAKPPRIAAYQKRTPNYSKIVRLPSIRPSIVPYDHSWPMADGPINCHMPYPWPPGQWLSWPWRCAVLNSLVIIRDIRHRFCDNPLVMRDDPILDPGDSPTTLLPSS